MKHSLLTVAILMLLCAVGFGDETAKMVAKTVLRVQVINSTASGKPVEGDEVFVQVFRNGQFFETLEARADANGVALFEDITTGVHVAALPRAKHGDMMFDGQAIELKAGQPQIDASVSVFEVSADKSKLSIRMHHVLIKAGTTSLEVTEFMQLANSSDMAISSDQRDNAGKPVILEVMLPKGFKNLKFGSYFREDAVIVTDEGFYDTMAVPPGEFSLEFFYSLDITSKNMNIVKGLSLPTSALVLFAELGRAKIQGLGEPYDHTMSTAGGEVEYYKRTNLAATDELAFKITGLSVAASNSSTWVILGVVFGGIMIVALVRTVRGAK